MVYDPENELYTATVYAEANRTFGFSTQLDDNGDMGGWNYLLPYRFGPDGVDGIFLLTDEYLGKRLPLTFDNWGNVRVTRTASYTITVSLEQNYIIIGKIEGSEPEVWDIGDVNHSHTIDIDDITMLINVVLGTPATGFFLEQANCDGDEGGTIDIDDITALINRILSGHW